MPSNTKEIRTRIKSVENTQKVTRSMKLIATIKLKQVQNAYHANHIYYDHFNHLFQRLISRLDLHSDREHWIFDSLKLSKDKDKKTDSKKVVLILLSSDRGLCGAYNAQLFKAFKQKLDQIKSDQVTVIPIGKKAVLHLHKNYPKLKTVGAMSNLSSIPSFDEADHVAQLLRELAPDYQEMQIIQNRYHSSVRVLVESKKIWSLEQVISTEIGRQSDRLHERSRELLLEPNALELVENLLPFYFKNLILEAMLTAKAGELAMRVNAMTAATDNAKALIETLKLSFNKARQANITQEISEIVAGASSVL
ncbi:MAG: ATP synthase F1 subunit gamma [Candidatus Caenarcaniphilales bacterium]|nr:ATP synthase F1 subunit gamma [Candidatus Caenarcaniphilales bacterium]